jgi:DNA-binding transcriptional ArsR family regulator
VAKIVLDSEAFKVLASDTRVQILKSLDERAKTVSELSRELELNKATVFEHLQQLVKGELVKKKDKDGRKWVYYTLTYKGTSLLHPETTTFMVLFSLSAIGALTAFWQLGNWLAWWGLGGGTPAEEAADVQIFRAEADSAPTADPGFFAFLGEPGFWIFFGLIAVTLALLVTGLIIRHRGRQQDALDPRTPTTGA